MKTVYLQKEIISKFKGVHNLEIDVAEEGTRIIGDNATGKTTVADAFIWTLFDKDTQGKKDFDIKTRVNGETLKGAEHKVELHLNVDGRLVKLAKIYKEKWVKKQGSANSEMKGHTTDYYVDDVPTKKKDYDALINAIIDEETFKLLTSPSYFAKLPWKDRRAILMTLVDELTDEQVISSNKDLKDVMNIMSGKSAEDFKKMVQSQQRAINDELKSIPARISENQNQVTEHVDDTQLQERLKSVEGLIEAAQKESYKIESGETLTNKKAQLLIAKSELDSFIRNYSPSNALEVAKLDVKQQEERANLMNMESDQRELTNRLNRLNNDRVLINNNIDFLNERREAALKMYHDLKNKVFEHKDECVCPTCDQALPEEKVAATRTRAEESFNATKESELEKILTEGKTLAADLVKNKDELTVINEQEVKVKVKLEKLELPIKEKKEVAGKISKEIAKLKSETPKVEDQTEYGTLQAKLNSLTKEVDELVQSNVEATNVIAQKINQLKLDKMLINEEISKIANSVNIKQRIEELIMQEESLTKQYQELSEKLFIVEEFVRAKVSMLEERINSKFKLTTFRLFKNQINGGLEECCDIIHDGVSFEGGLNNAMKINVGLDIINTLSNHHQIKAPIFIDNAESVTKFIDIDAQIIALVVDENCKELTQLADEDE